MAHLYSMETTKLNELLKSGEADAGAGLFTQAQKISLNQNSFTMMIGIGGTGVKALNRVKQYLVNRVADHQNNVCLLAIDSDKVSLDSLTHLDDSEKFQISINPATANNLVNVVANRSTELIEWINPQFNVPFNTDGANQIRQAGRAKLFVGETQAQTIDTKLRNAIKAASAKLQTPAGVNLQVFLLAGLSGGTGSGTFIDVAMLVKDANPTADISGFFFLPDTVEDYVNNPTNLYANGYAALKEIDYYVGIRQWHDGISEGHPTADHGGANTKFDRNHPLFNMVTLVSGSPTSFLNPDKGRAASDTAVESIINLISADQCVTTQGQPPMLISSFLSNADAARNAVIAGGIGSNGMEKAGYFLDDNFSYSGIGIATASIPEQICTSYVVRRLIEKMFVDNTSAVSYAIVGKPSLAEHAAQNQILSLFGMTNGTQISVVNAQTRLRNSVDSNATPQGLESTTDKRDVIAGTDDARISYNTQGENGIVKTATGIVTKALSDMFTTFRLNAIAFIKNYGPQALVDLYDGRDTDGKPYQNVKSMKVQLSEVFATLKLDTNAISRLQNSVKEERERKILGVSACRVDVYLGRLTKLINEECYQEVWNAAFNKATKSNLVTTMLIDPVENFIEDCRDLAVLLTSLSSIYTNLSSNFASHQTFIEAQDSSVNINIISDQSAYNWAKAKLDDIVSSIDGTALVSAIVDEYFADTNNYWHLVTSRTGKDTLLARMSFDRLIGDTIRNANNNTGVMLSVDDYIDYNMSNGQNLSATIRTIADRLLNAAQPLFRTAQGSINLATSHYYVVIPQSIALGANGNDIVTAFETSMPDVEVYLSKATDKIVCYHFAAGYPLYSLADLPLWENAYFGNLHAFIHRNESGIGDFNPMTGLEWKNYPNCRCNFDARQIGIGNPDRTPEYSFLTSEFDPTIQKALDYGILRRQDAPGGGCFYQLYNIDWPNGNYDLTNYVNVKHGQYVGGAPFVDHLIGQNGNPAPKTVELAMTTQFTAPTTALTGNLAVTEPLKRAKRVLRRNVKLYLELKRSVKKYDDVFPAGGGTSVLFAAEVFIKAYMAGLISEQNGVWSFQSQALFNANAIAEFAWSASQKYLVKNNFRTLVLFLRFYELHNDWNDLDAIEKDCTAELGNILVADPTGAVMLDRKEALKTELTAVTPAMSDIKFQQNVLNGIGSRDPKDFEALHFTDFYQEIQKI